MTQAMLASTISQFFVIGEGVEKGAVQLFLCKSVEDVPKVKGKGDD